MYFYCTKSLKKHSYICKVTNYNIMKLISIALLFSFLSFSKISTLHPVHISVTNVDYNETEQVFNVSIKLFADDFETIINKNNNINLNIGKAVENKKCNSYIDEYIQNSLVLKINNRNIFKNVKLLKKELKPEENTIWLYYNIKHTSSVKNVNVINNLLNDLYNDQKNLFIFTYKNTEEAYKFEKNNTKFEFLIK